MDTHEKTSTGVQDIASWFHGVKCVLLTCKGRACTARCARPIMRRARDVSSRRPRVQPRWLAMLVR